MRISDWSSDVCSSDLEPVADAAGHVLHEFERSVLDQHQKLVTPQARHAVAFAHARADMKRNGLNQAIAHQMAVMVVDLLEIVQIQEQDAKTLAIVKRLVDFLVDGMAIGQARKEIGRAQV